MQFTPNSDAEKKEAVPFFEDVSSAAGWAGHATSKKVVELQSQIAAAIGKLGGLVAGWQRGDVVVDGKSRPAYKVFITIQNNTGDLLPAEFVVAALPLRTNKNKRGYETKLDQSLRMALFNLRDQFEVAYRMQQLIPGLFPLIPFMLDQTTQKPFYELFADRQNMNNLLPEVAGVELEVVDASFKEQ